MTTKVYCRYLYFTIYHIYIYQGFTRFFQILFYDNSTWSPGFCPSAVKLGTDIRIKQAINWWSYSMGYIYIYLYKYIICIYIISLWVLTRFSRTHLIFWCNRFFRNLPWFTPLVYTTISWEALPCPRCGERITTMEWLGNSVEHFSCRCWDFSLHAHSMQSNKYPSEQWKEHRINVLVGKMVEISSYGIFSGW